MKAVCLNDEVKTCYITGTNEELKKMLNACNYHTKLAPKNLINFTKYMRKVVVRLLTLLT